MTAKLSPDDKGDKGLAMPGPWVYRPHLLQNGAPVSWFVGPETQVAGIEELPAIYVAALAKDTEANARLVAAAPELLSIVGIFLGHDDRFQVAVGGNPNAVDAMLAKARGVYAKATGGQP